MTKEIRTTNPGVDMTGFDVAAAIKELLPRGHVIHGYSSAMNERVIKILKTRKYSDGAEMLGFGVDGRAERALGRALLTYAMRERDGLPSIRANQYPETDQDQVAGGQHLSKFDNIVWGGDFTLYQKGKLVVASSRYGGEGGMGPLEVSGPDAVTAITEFAEAYTFIGGGSARIRTLPALSFE